MVKKNNNGITLDELAGMVSRRFDEIEGKFDEIEGKMVTKDEFRVLEKKVDKIDFRVDEMYDILKRFEGRFLFS